MRNRLLLIILPLFIFVVCSGFAPAGAFSLDIDTSQLGNVTVYVNPSYRDNYFTVVEVSDGVFKPVLLYNSYISGYILNVNGVRTYELRINPYGEQWQYRLVNSSSYNWSYLTVNSVDLESSTVLFVGQSIDDNKLIYYLLLFFSGALLLGVWRCARK